MKPLLKTLPLMLSAPLLAQVDLTLIGGGPNPANSQFSIESNVIWFYQLAKQGNFDDIALYFTSGGETSFDVHFRDNTDSALGALSDLYYDPGVHQLVYRPADPLLQSAKPATREEVLMQLNQQSDDQSDQLLLFSGHGGRSEQADNNYLKLWEDTELSVSDLHEVLYSEENRATVRFIAPQCFSGGFTALAYQDLKQRSGVDGRICGFTSVSEWDYSEGCTASVNTDDYRDYATLLMESLTGQNRHGKPVVTASDLNQDGQISLREAHLHVLGSAQSADLPRSTSEAYLLDQQRWYERWLSGFYQPGDNPYANAARQLSSDFNHPFGSNAYRRELLSALTEARMELAEAARIEYENMDERVLLQNALRDELEQHWPQLANPVTARATKVISENLSDMNKWIEQHPDYPDLQERVNNADKLSQRWLTLNREHARLQRIVHLLTLSRLHDRVVSEDGKRSDEYQALLECEDWKPPF